MKRKDRKSYTFKCSGKELAKVLYYYGLIYNTSKMEYKIPCPFHNDINPSMICNIDTGTYFCFGCGCSGDAHTFVREVNKDKNDVQALLEYFRIIKSDKVNSLDLSGRVKRKKKSSKKLYDMAWDYYYGLRTFDWEVDEDEEVTKAKSYMKKRGFNASTLNNCRAKVTYNKQYPIIFPMFDNGKFKGWVCRTTLKEVEKKRKYLYNDGFKRAETLVGDYKNVETVFIVEGYMDRLKFVQYGVKNAVAILGWKMSDEQIDKLKSQGITHVISALDNDDCGIKGTDYLKKHFKVTRFSYLKGIKDVGEMDKPTFDKCYRRTLKKYKLDKVGKEAKANTRGE